MALLKNKHMKIKVVILRKRKKSERTGSFPGEKETRHFSQKNNTHFLELVINQDIF